ncbi:LamG-like jellyroll fold domain-containing protein [Sedimentisphaera salicampi]|uniref:Immunoglobulin I-set domain protein n=1 Tax=Sedimentisphaera salicampi TaxID=1941349 RepID=A0A1W6LKN3_9BACT|nr:LamG-like jellyroll fold domain-containing protein [Sedimentisphaera salicampi]ARN56325.1 Immunoglobulin I-set domain protein [Sedimentisphaera salicampi]
MMKIYKFFTLIVCLSVASACFAGEIVPEFDDSDAIVDYSERQLQNSSDMTGIVDSGLITLTAKFTPTEADTTKTDGPVIVTEVGGSNYGTGIFICDGMLTFGSKGANGSGGGNAVVESLNDTDASGDGGVAVALGPVYPNIETELFVSFNSGTGELIAMINGRLYTETITGSVQVTNLSGNRTVSVLGWVPGPDEDYGVFGGLNNSNDPPDLVNQANVVAMETVSGTPLRGQIFEDVVDPDLWPRNPVPANGEVNVDPVAVTSLQFDTAGEPGNTSNPNPNVTGHFVTAYSTFDPADPNNNVEALSAFVPAGSDPVQVPFTFELGDEIYWKVEEQINNAAEGSAENIAGPIWHFEALPAIPAITASPADQADFTGEEVTFNAAFTSKTAASVEWVKAGDPETIVDDTDPDITIGVSQHGDSYTTSLSVANLERDDQGEYFCRASNQDGTADSDSAMLGVKRMIGYWPLDGDYTDASGEGLNADPNVAPLPEQWVDGVDPAKTGQGFDTVPEPLAAAATEPLVPAPYTDELTVSLWVKWTGDIYPSGGLAGLICSSDPDGGENNWFFDIQPDGQLTANTPGYVQWGVPEDHYITPDQWMHVAFVNDADQTGRLYVNGSLVQTNDDFMRSKFEQRVYIMCTGETNGQLGNPGLGVFDEIKMYNYALTNDQIAQQYHEIMGGDFCTDPYSEDLKYDFNGDCKVNLADLAMFALDWNESNLYPQLD